MFVVLEYNQASHMPSVFDTDIFYDQGQAEESAAAALADAQARGRRERYMVAELDVIEEN